MYSTALTKGSILEKQEKEGKSLPEVLSEAVAVVVVDTSGSMSHMDDGKTTRFTKAQRELNELQRRFPGQIVIMEFNYSAEIRISGTLNSPSGGTCYMNPLIKLKEIDDVGLKFFFISDGEPNEPEDEIYEYLRIAKFGTPLNTIYIGEEAGLGEEILRKMAMLTRGKHFEFGVNFEYLLSQTVGQLLLEGN